MYTEAATTGERCGDQASIPSDPLVPTDNFEMTPGQTTYGIITNLYYRSNKLNSKPAVIFALI